MWDNRSVVETTTENEGLIMKSGKCLFACLTAALCLFCQKGEAVTYVTDTGGYAYDESRAATNLAPAIALGTVVVVAIIAIAVQNSHHSSHSH